MSGLELAIEQLELEVSEFQQGTQAQPKEHTSEWFILRAKTLGLSYLMRTRQLGLEFNPEGAELFYRDCSGKFKKVGE